MRRLACALALYPLAACQQSAPLQVNQVWARDTVGSLVNAAVYMTIVSPTSDRLVSASTPIAKTTALMTMDGGSEATEMRYVKAIDLPSGKPVDLAPTGLHVWLTGLRQPLKAGQSFPLLLDFDKAGQRPVTVRIIAPAAAPPGSAMTM